MNPPLNVTSERVDDIVLLLEVMKQMGLPKLLNEYLPRHWKQQGLDWGWVIVIWLSYILSEGDHRKVVVRSWVAQRQRTIEQVCGIEISETDFSDDRLSIALKHISVEDVWQSIEQDLNRRTLRIYELPSETVRLDATTISGEHLVNEAGLFQFGYSKDDPSVGQVKLMMADLDPLGMPLATQVVSGEQSDDGMYLPVFEQVRASLPQHPLLWVGDCKMAATATRNHIHNHDHYYLMPLPRTGEVPQEISQRLRAMRAAKAELKSVEICRSDGQDSTFLSGYEVRRGMEGKTVEGYPVCWYEQGFLVHSLSHQQRQEAGLNHRLQNATTKLLKLTPPVGRGHKQITQQSELEQKAEAILKAHRVTGLLDYNFTVETQGEKQKTRYQITEVNTNETELSVQQETFGWRLYVSNATTERLSFEEAVLTYRDEWIVEHGFHRFKGKSLGAHPVFVHRDDQVQGLLHLLSLGLRLLTLIEFVVHRKLKQSDETLSGLYPENPKKCTNRPSTERLLKAFENITMTIFTVEGQSYRHLTPLTSLQQEILQLLGFSPQVYTDLLKGSG
jgi:transposase